MNEKDLEKYISLSDPNNQFIRKLLYGGDEGLQQLQEQAICQSISEKYNVLKDDTNEFLNSLTEDELLTYLSKNQNLS